MVLTKSEVLMNDKMFAVWMRIGFVTSISICIYALYIAGYFEGRLSNEDAVYHSSILFSTTWAAFGLNGVFFNFIPALYGFCRKTLGVCSLKTN